MRQLFTSVDILRIKKKKNKSLSSEQMKIFLRNIRLFLFLLLSMPPTDCCYLSALLPRDFHAFLSLNVR